MTTAPANDPVLHSRIEALREHTAELDEMHLRLRRRTLTPLERQSLRAQIAALRHEIETLLRQDNGRLCWSRASTEGGDETLYFV